MTVATIRRDIEDQPGLPVAGNDLIWMPRPFAQMLVSLAEKVGRVAEALDDADLSDGIDVDYAMDELFRAYDALEEET